MYKILLIYFTTLRVMITSMEETSGPGQPTAESKQDFLWKYGEPMSDTALKASLPCIKPIQDALEIFLSVPQDDLDALPNFWFSRITYLIIFSMFLNLRVIGSEKKTQKDSKIVPMRLDDYLNRITDKLQTSSHGEHNAVVQKLALLLKMFKSWYERQRDGPRRPPLKRNPQDAANIPAEPIDSERNTPRLGYRKLSVHSDSNSEGATKSKSKSPVVPPRQDTLAPTSQPKPPAPAAQLGDTPLNILSQVASNEPSASAHQPPTATAQQQQQQHQAQQPAPPVPQDSWYNQMNAYPSQPYVAETQHYYPPPDQHDFAHVNGYAMDGYQHMAMDPELEQAMCSAFGSEGNMMGTFFNDFFSMNHVQGGMPYGNWYPPPEQ